MKKCKETWSNVPGLFLQEVVAGGKVKSADPEATDGDS